MDTKAGALQGWLSGNFVDAALLPVSFAQLRDGCAEWDLKSFHRGVFPWRLDQAAWDGKPEIELLTELALRIGEHQRSQEELSLIEEEMASFLQLYARQASALHQALASVPQSPSRSGEAHEESSLVDRIQRCEAQKAARKQAGRKLVLQQKLDQVNILKAHAEQAFSLASGGNMQQAIAQGALSGHFNHLEEDVEAASGSDSDDV